MTDLIDSPVKTASATFDAYSVAQCLKAVKPAVAGRGVLPIIQSVKVNGGVFTATNLDLTITTPAPGPTDDLNVAVPFNLFDSFLKGVTAKKTEPLTVTELNNTEVELRMGNRRRTVQVLPVDDYPRISEDCGEGGVPVDTAKLAAVYGAVSNDDARPILTSVAISKGRYVSTDSYRLYVAEGAPDIGDREILLPRAMVKEAIRLGGEPILSWGERELSFLFGDGTTVTHRSIDGEFPNWQGLLVVDTPVAFTVDRVAAVEALKVLKAGKIGEKNTPVRVNGLEQGGVELKLINQGVGEDAVTVPGTAIGQEVGDESSYKELALNPDYLLDLLDGLPGKPMRVEIKSLMGTGKPIVVSVTDDGTVFHRLLMPVRIS